MKSKVAGSFIRLVAGVLLAAGFTSFVAMADAIATDSPTNTTQTSTETGRHPGPKEVVIGAYIENLQGIDLNTNSFQADLYVWMRWMDPALKPYESIEVMNPYETWALTATPITDAPMRQPDGSLYYSIRYQGGFNTNFDLSEFPFGEQQPQIQLEDKILENDQLTYVLDTTPIALDPEVTLPGYDIQAPSIKVAAIHYPTSFGEISGKGNDVYSRVTIVVPVTHPFLATSIKVLLPVILIIATASLIFRIPPKLFEPRIGLGITALLTLVAMQWSALSSLPDGGYLVMLDIIYIISYAFVLIALVQSISTSWKARAGDINIAIRRDRKFMFLDLGVYFLLTAGTLLLYLH